MASVLAVLFKEEHPDWSKNLEAFSFATPPVFRYVTNHIVITCELVMNFYTIYMYIYMQLYPGSRITAFHHNGDQWLRYSAENDHQGPRPPCSLSQRSNQQ